jgi:hypothetical protein
MQRVWIAVLATMAAAAVPAPGSDPAKPNDSKQIVSHIPRQRVQSTAIAAVGYSKRRHILEIEFVNGAIYRYRDVPPSVYRDLMSAKSKARFYDFNIKKKYRSVRIRSYWKDEQQN